MKYSGDWEELFPMLKQFDEAQFNELRIEQQQCQSDSRMYKYTLFFNKLPIETKVWRDDDKRTPEYASEAKIPRLMCDSD